MYLHFNMMTSSNGNIFRVTGPLCGEFTGPGELPTQRPVTLSFDVFFDQRLNQRLSKQPWGWWFETPSWSLWRQSNETKVNKLNDNGVWVSSLSFKIFWEFRILSVQIQVECSKHLSFRDLKFPMPYLEYFVCIVHRQERSFLTDEWIFLKNTQASETKIYISFALFRLSLRLSLYMHTYDIHWNHGYVYKHQTGKKWEMRCLELLHSHMKVDKKWYLHTTKQHIKI